MPVNVLITDAEDQLLSLLKHIIQSKEFNVNEAEFK